VATPGDVVEKDYVLGWLLWGIATDPALGNQWVFKGGTCLKKCYIETYRFSEDLDFTVLPGDAFTPEQVEPLLLRVLTRVQDASGIDFSVQEPALRLRPDGLSTEGRVYYVGPRQARQPARVKLDISANEKVIRPPVLRAIAHAYPERTAQRGGSLLLVRRVVRREDPCDGATQPAPRSLRHRQLVQA
jgi:hypothetical protein